MTLSKLKKADIGKAVRYISSSGHTAMDGILDSYDAEFIYCKFSSGEHKISRNGIPGKHGFKQNPEVAVQCDPSNVEFVSA